MTDGTSLRARHFASCILHFAFCILHFAFCISPFCLLPSSFCLGQQCGPSGCPRPTAGRTLTLPAEVCAAIVKIRVEEGRTAGSGSGTFVEPGLVVTNWHVVCERATDQVTLTWPGRGDTAGRVLGADEARDLAVIEPEAPAGVTPLALRETRPEIGEPLSVAGYVGGQMPLRGMAGVMTSIARNRDGDGWYFVETTALSQPGMSGGPMLDGHQPPQLAGVLFGSDGASTAGAHCVEVCGFIDRVCPGRRKAGGGNRGGRQIVTGQPRQGIGNSGLGVGASNPNPQPQAPNPLYATKSDLAALAGRVSRLEQAEHVTPDALDQALSRAKQDLQKALSGNLAGAISDARTQIKQDALAAVNDALANKLAPLAEVAGSMTGVAAKPGGATNPWIAPVLTAVSILGGALLIRKGNTPSGGAGGAAAPAPFHAAVNPKSNVQRPKSGAAGQQPG